MQTPSSKTKGLGVFQKDIEAARSDRRRRGGRAGLAAQEAAERPRPHRDAERRRAGLGQRARRSRRASSGRTSRATPTSGPATRRTYAGKTPAIAIVDSGVQKRCRLRQPRLIASVNLSTIDGNTSTRTTQRGHGTFVAGIAAGAAPDLAGAAPGAPIVSIKVMNEQGRRRRPTSSRPASGSSTTRRKYNIRVANFSLHSSYSTNFYRDPLDQAVEKLWFNGVVVVAAAGNYGIGERALGRALRAGQRPVRDHRRRGRPRQQPAGERRHRRAVVGLRLHARTASTSRTSLPRAATWWARSRPARRSRRRRRRTWSAPTGSSSPARRSRHRSSRARSRRCWRGIRAGRRIR